MKSLLSSAMVLRTPKVCLMACLAACGGLAASCTTEDRSGWDEDSGQNITGADSGAADAGDSLDGGTADGSGGPHDGGANPSDAGPPDGAPDFTREARVYFDLHVRPVLLDPVNLCINCHTYDYGYPRSINWLEVPGETIYRGVAGWRTAGGDQLFNTEEPEVSMPSQSILFSKGRHGFSGVAPPYPAAAMGFAKEWVKLERNACRSRPGPTGNDCVPARDAGPGDAGQVVVVDPRTAAHLDFETNVRPMMQARACATCHSGTGIYASFNINFLASFPTATPTNYDSILTYKLTGGVPHLFNFNQVQLSLILAKGAHAGPALASNANERVKVQNWLEKERLAACDEGTIACAGPTDAGPPPDAAVTTDAGAGLDAGAVLSATDIARSYYAQNVSNVLNAQGCFFCHAGEFGALQRVNYMDHLGAEFEYESVVDYVSADFRQLYDFSTPADSLMLTQGVHLGDTYGRPESRMQDIENFKTWVMLEQTAQQVFITDAGVRPDAAPAIVDAGFDAGRDAALPLGFDAGPPTPRQLAEAYFSNTIYPHLVSQSCTACHSGALSRSYAPPVNWLDITGLGAYRSSLAWRTAANYPLLDFEQPQYSLLAIKPRHYNGLAPGYVPMGNTTVLPEFVTWVNLERAAAIAEGTYSAPVPDAGQPVVDAGPLDSGTPVDAGLDAGLGSPDASVERAAARDYFVTHVYTGLSTITRPEATCQGCHVQGNPQTAFMVVPGESASLTEQRYQFIRNNSNLVNKQVPSASLFLIKDENHEGGQGLLRPASRETDRTHFLNWVNLEKAADNAELGITGTEFETSGCETQFLPNIPPVGSLFPEETTIELGTRLCRPELAGVTVTVRAIRVGSGLEFSYVTLITPPNQSLRVTTVLFTRWTRSVTADGGIRYFPAEIVDIDPGFNGVIPGNSFFPITQSPGVIMANFFGAGGSPDAGGLNSYLSIEFGFIGPEVVPDAGPLVDGGPVQLTPCTNLAVFESAVRPRLMSNNLDGGGAACTACHTGGTGFTRPTSMMNLTTLQTNPALACANVKQWVNPVTPGNSVLFQNVDPANTGNPHGWWFPSTGTEFQNFRAALTPWIMSEAQ